MSKLPIKDGLSNVIDIIQNSDMEPSDKKYCVKKIELAIEKLTEIEG